MTHHCRCPHCSAINGVPARTEGGREIGIAAIAAALTPHGPPVLHGPPALETEQRDQLLRRLQSREISPLVRRPLTARLRPPLPRLPACPAPQATLPPSPFTQALFIHFSNRNFSSSESSWSTYSRIATAQTCVRSNSTRQSGTSMTCRSFRRSCAAAVCAWRMCVRGNACERCRACTPFTLTAWKNG
eukprot:scaffold144848_cov31-Tisochrysis_lutea.AAC.2